MINGEIPTMDPSSTYEAARPNSHSFCSQFSVTSTLGVVSMKRMRILHWFKEPQFYLVALIYTATRLCVNVSNSYMTLFLQHSLKLENTYVAVIPLVMYVTGFLTSIILKFWTKRFGFKVSFALSCVIGIVK